MNNITSQFHYTNILNDNELDFTSDYDVSSSQEKSISPIKIHNWNAHVHHDCLIQKNSRDFHKVVIQIYDTLSTEDKNDVEMIKKMNYYINKWHFTPNEIWGTVWENFAYYLGSRFPPDEYPEIIKIFNCQ
jgi:hypothetical protein